MIREALRRTNPDKLGEYIYDYVTRPDCTIAKLEADGMPCHPRTFKVHKAHFFCELDKLAQHGASLTGKSTADDLKVYAAASTAEVREAVTALRGERTDALVDLCLAIGASILVQAGAAENETQARAMMQRSVDDGPAQSNFVLHVGTPGDNVGNSEERI